MRLGLIGVSHWHAPLYYQPAARLADVHIGAVSDADPGVAARVGREVGAAAFTDYRELIATRPDFVFAFGRHCDLPTIAAALIDAAVPCLLEKPGGLNYAQVAAVRDRATARGAYVGTGFNFRVSALCKTVRAVIADDPVTHASFRYIGGGPYRYREAGCAWMLDPALAGGGCTLNLGIHFVDLFRLWTGSEVETAAAVMGHCTWGLPIEDSSSVVLRAPRALGTIETGYTYPARMGVFDLRFSIRTPRHYILVREDDRLDIHRACDGHVESLSTPTSNAAWYPVFVAESLDRFRRGDPPVADLTDLASAMAVIDAAYASHQAGGVSTAPPDR
jgi:predicted dehydrogenase